MESGKLFRSKAEKSWRLRSSFPIMITCLLISTFLWFLIMLSKNYTAHVRFSLLYDSIPEGKMITNHLPKRMDFLINASGFDLLSYRLKSTNNDITISVSDNLDERNRIANNVYRVPTRNLLSEFTEQLKRDVNIQSATPDSIEFNFTSLLTKKVPLKSNVKVNFEKQFEATDSAKLIPESIVVSGPLSYLDSLQFIETADTVLNNVKGNLNQSVRLKFHNDISSAIRSAHLVLPVEKFTEGTIQVSLQAVNTEGNHKVKIFPDKVTVNYLVALSNYEKVTGSQFNAAADVSEIGNGSNKLNVQLLKSPDFVKITSVEPRKVEYIILE